MGRFVEYEKYNKPIEEERQKELDKIQKKMLPISAIGGLFVIQIVLIIAIIYSMFNHNGMLMSLVLLDVSMFILNIVLIFRTDGKENYCKSRDLILEIALLLDLLPLVVFIAIGAMMGARIAIFIVLMFFAGLFGRR